MEYIVFGTTYGFSYTDVSEEERRFIEQFYRDDSGSRTYINKRYNNKVYYTRTIYGDQQNSFTDSKGRPGAFLGITLGFDKQYCRDLQKIDRVFNKIYQDFITKGILREKNNSRQFLISDFQKYQQEIYESVVDAIRFADLKSNDFEPFTFQKLHGTYYCHPSDAPRLNKALMDMPYNIDICDRHPTQEMLRQKLSNTK